MFSLPGWLHSLSIISLPVISPTLTRDLSSTLDSKNREGRGSILLACFVLFCFVKQILLRAYCMPDSVLALMAETQVTISLWHSVWPMVGSSEIFMECIKK